MYTSMCGIKCRLHAVQARNRLNEKVKKNLTEDMQNAGRPCFADIVRDVASVLSPVSVVDIGDEQVAVMQHLPPTTPCSPHCQAQALPVIQPVVRGSRRCLRVAYDCDVSSNCGGKETIHWLLPECRSYFCNVPSNERSLHYQANKYNSS